MRGYWATESAKVIRRVIQENPGLVNEDLRRKASEAYPFGERRMFPYKQFMKTMSEMLGPSPKEKARLAEMSAKEGSLFGDPGTGTTGE